MADVIPQELKAVDQWVIWKYEGRNGSGKPTKVPYQPNGQRASSTDPKTWVDYHTAVASAEESEGEYAGVGFVVTDRDDFVGIDIDHCFDPETGTLADHAVNIIRKCNSYTEISPSGQGVRIICRAHNLVPSARSPLVEVYPSRRFLTITGNILGEPKGVRHADDGILFALKIAGSQKRDSRSEQTGDPTVERIKDAGLYQRQTMPGVHEITCPWADSHTGGDTTGTKYLEAHFNGFNHATFHCHHAHCASRTTSEFLKVIGAKEQTEDDEESSANPFFWVGHEIFARAPVHSWAIQNYLTEGTVSLLYGKKDTYKSFVAISMGMAVAAGVGWYGNKTERGGFAYLCGEGRSGIAGRMEAWCVRNKVDPKELPLFLGKQRMKLDDPGEVQTISDSLVQTIEALGWPKLRVLIIDTLSSSTPGLDENDAGAMSLAIDNVKALICDRIGCAAVIVHHAGKDMERGARGSSALEANSEAVFTSTRKDEGGVERVVIECKHIKDADKPAPLVLERHLQHLDGERINLVFDPITRAEIEKASFMQDRRDEKARVLELLREGKSIRDVEQHVRAEGMHASKSTIQRWRDQFVESGAMLDVVF
jgi:hypothetical protein